MLLLAQAPGGEAYRRGTQLFDQGRFGEAATSYAEALRLNPADAQYAKALGVALAAGREYRAALGPLKQACRARPAPEDACYFYARALYGADFHEESRVEMERLLEGDRAPGRVELGLGQALEALGRYGEAESWYQRAMARPGGAQRLAYGRFLIRQGRATEAIPVLKGAAPAPDVHFELGRALAETGRLGEAVAELDRALALEPGHEAARVLRRRLEARRAASGAAAR